MRQASLGSLLQNLALERRETGELIGNTGLAVPDFLLVGAPKAGTTALHVALARHPQLFMSRVKEPKHFLSDGPPSLGGGPGDAKTALRPGRAAAPSGHQPLGTLTPRETEVLRRIVAGQSTRQMASEMNVSVSTLRSYVKNILAKLGAHSRLQAAAIASGRQYPSVA